MDELIRDPLWTFVGVICAVVSVIITILIFIAQRKIKRLSYEFTSSTQLLSVKDEIQGKIQVLYDGEEVKNVHLLTIRFVNNGNQSISSADYERPVSIEVNSEAKILTHEVINESPENLGLSVFLDGRKLIFSSVLINAKDSFSIKALISDFKEVYIDGRINGVKSVSEYKEGQRSLALLLLISFVLVGFGAFNVGMNEALDVLGVQMSSVTFGGVFIFAGYAVMFFGKLRSKRRRV